MWGTDQPYHLQVAELWSWGQNVLKQCPGVRTWTASPPERWGNTQGLLEIQILKVNPNAVNQKFWGWSPASYGNKPSRWIYAPLKLVDMSLSKLREFMMDREAWRDAIHGVAKSRTRLSDWTELNWKLEDHWDNRCTELITVSGTWAPELHLER